MTPTNVIKYKAVAPGTTHVLALRHNGTVVTWGRKFGDIPVDLHDVTQIAAGDEHSLALTKDGRVIAWGNNSHNQCNVPAELEDVIQIAAGYRHSLALMRNGEVVAWGDNTEEQCRVPNTVKDVVQIAAGDTHSLALTKYGRVFIWGDNKYFQCNLPDMLNSKSSVDDVHRRGLFSQTSKFGRLVYSMFAGALISSDQHGISHDVAIPRLTQIAAGYRHSLALTDNGRVIAWGENLHGQCDVPNDLQEVTYIAAGKWHSLALTSHGEVVAWGDNYRHRVVPPELNDVVCVAAGDRYSFAVTVDGSLVAWGDDHVRQSEKKFEGVCVAQVTSRLHGLAVSDDGSVVAWGDNTHGQCNIPATLKDVVHVATGLYHSLAVTKHGQVLAWGSNEFGQCDVPAVVDVVQVVAGLYHSLAVTKHGQVLAWGSNEFGQCDVPAVVDVVYVAAGSFHSLAVTTHGQVVAWGSNEFGQCDVPAVVDVVQVAAGDDYSLALTVHGQVVAWGDGLYESQELTDVVQISAGRLHVLGLQQNGRVVACGGNHGQSTIPVWLRDVVQVIAGDYYSYAILQDGAVVTWGGNSIACLDKLIQIGSEPQLQYVHAHAEIALSGGEAQLYSVENVIFKKYHSPYFAPNLRLPSELWIWDPHQRLHRHGYSRQNKIQALLEDPVTLSMYQQPSIIWPKQMVFHPFTGDFLGFVMEYVDAIKLLDVFDMKTRSVRWPEFADWHTEFRFLLTVAHECAVVLAHIHKNRYIVGDISACNILVRDDGSVAYIDCDSYLHTEVANWSPFLSTPAFMAPEVIAREHPFRLFSAYSDAFALAVIIFRLLCNNVDPYQGITLPSQAMYPDLYNETKRKYPHLKDIPDGVDATLYCVTNRIWPYDESQQYCVPPVMMQSYYPLLPARVQSLFLRAFTGMPDNRPTPDEWSHVIEEWLRDIDNLRH